jgi:hypothetical protein
MSRIIYDPETGFLYIKVLAEELDTIQELKQPYERTGFKPKDEFHITVMGRRLGQRLKELSTVNHSLQQSLEELIANTNWHYEIGNECYHVTKDKQEDTEAEVVHAESIIINATVPAIQSFFSQLSHLAGENIESPFFPHITLYTLGDDQGIGIYSEEDFNNYVKEQINLRDLQDI